MREQDVLRDALERAARSAMGASPYGDRRTEAQARSTGLEALIASLPVNSEDVPGIQVLTPGDPNEGKFYIMLGFSTLDGDDILA